MHTVANLLMPDWLEHASSARQFFTLSLPILVAVLMVFSASVLWERDPWTQIQMVMAVDQAQLGHRRFTPARRWFSAFTLSLFEAQSVLQTDAARADVLDLAMLDAESELLVDLGDYAESEEVRSLQDLVAHFRREVILEAGDDELPGLAETWVGYGSQRLWRVGPYSRSETQLRIYNADDLGRQMVTRTIAHGFGSPSSGRPSAADRKAALVWRAVRGAHWHRLERPVALIVIAEIEPSPAEVESALHRLKDVRSVGRRRRRLVFELLQTGRSRSVQSTTSDELVEVIQDNSRWVGMRGDVAAWTTDAEFQSARRTWSTTLAISGGPARELPHEGPVRKSTVRA